MPHTAKQQRVYRYRRDLKRAVEEHHEGMQPYMHQCYMNKLPSPMWFSDLMNMDEQSLDVLMLSIKRAKQLRRRRDALQSDSESDSDSDDVQQPTIIQRRDVQRANRSQAMIQSHSDRRPDTRLNQLSHDYETMFDKHVDVPSSPPYDLSHDLDEVMRDFTAIFGA